MNDGCCGSRSSKDATHQSCWCGNQGKLIPERVAVTGLFVQMSVVRNETQADLSENQKSGNHGRIVTECWNIIDEGAFERRWRVGSLLNLGESNTDQICEDSQDHSMRRVRRRVSQQHAWLVKIGPTMSALYAATAAIVFDCSMRKAVVRPRQVVRLLLQQDERYPGKCPRLNDPGPPIPCGTDG
jgi:hypothetical protein